jgi:hypothetical protein
LFGAMTRVGRFTRDDMGHRERFAGGHAEQDLMRRRFAVLGRADGLGLIALGFKMETSELSFVAVANHQEKG